MTTTKFQRMFLRQYRKLHEAHSPRRVMALAMAKTFLGNLLVVSLIVALNYFVAKPLCLIFAIFGAGLISGILASNFGTLIRRGAAWAVIEEITNWPKVYELLADRKLEESDRSKPNQITGANHGQR